MWRAQVILEELLDRLNRPLNVQIWLFSAKNDDSNPLIVWPKPARVCGAHVLGRIGFGLFSVIRSGGQPGGHRHVAQLYCANGRILTHEQGHIPPPFKNTLSLRGAFLKQIMCRRIG
jgi:hypothetical protein